MIHRERVRPLNNETEKSRDYILYWMQASQRALQLNNKYEIDGRDANGFTGVAWCFGKHDRAWPTHRVFGKVRIMTASGLRRKFDADAYVRKYEVQHG
jgi:deoxyribodipyrimidine photo-lyase